MEPIGGDLKRHDQEFEDVRWVAFDDAAGLLTFETERALVARAAENVAANGRAGAGVHRSAETVSAAAGSGAEIPQ